MQEKVRTLLCERLSVGRDEWETWLPASHMSRQTWQEAVELMVDEIRKFTNRPAFGLTETEITVHYHKTLLTLAKLLEEKIQ